MESNVEALEGIFAQEQTTQDIVVKGREGGERGKTPSDGINRNRFDMDNE